MQALGIALGALAFATTLAVAQTNNLVPSGHEPSVSVGRNIGPRGSGGGHRAGDLQAQQAAKVGLLQAIDAAESGSQGHAVEAGFEIQGGGHYEVKILGKDGTFTEHHVDAITGQVIKIERRPIEEFLTRLKPADVQSARTTLRQALAIAEQQAGGQAAEVAVRHEGNTISYRVTVTSDDRMQEIWLDADGKIILSR
jgi:uncharacterized membrane protein YkoI